MRNLKPFTLPFAGALLALALATPLRAHDGEHHGAAVTLKGEIVDLGCFLGHQSKGPGHAKCALQCAQKGMPIGLLAADGTLYLLTMDHADAKPFEAAKAKAGQNVTITGEVHEGSGMKSLEVKQVS